MGPPRGPRARRRREKGRQCVKNRRFDSNQTVRKTSQKNYLLSDKVDKTWRREERPFTRAQSRLSKAITRIMSCLDAARKLKFTCGCCASAEKTAPRQRGPQSKHQSPKAHHNIKKQSTDKRKVPRERKGCEARVWRTFGQVSTAEAAAAPAPAARSPTSFGDYIHLLPFAFANSKSSVKQVTACDCQSTGRKQQESKTCVIKQGGLNPKVKLCDIGPICVECKHKCSFVLPDDVKYTLVHCFTKEMRAGFRFEPGCLGHKTHSFNEIVQVVNNGRLPNLDSEKILSLSTKTNEQNEDVRNDTHSEALSSHIHLGQESKGPASCSSEHRLKLNMNSMQKEFTDYNQNILGKDANNMVFDEKADILSKDSHLKNSVCVDTFGSVKCVEGQSDSPAQVCNPVHFEGESKDGLSMTVNGPTLDNAEDSFTCQRVKVYSGKTSVTCARTYLSWPFLSRKPNAETAGNDASSAGHISTFQNKPSGNEPNDPDPQKRFSISNQRVGGTRKNSESILENAENVVDESLDIIRNINDLDPSCSSQQSVQMLPEKHNLCKDLAAWFSQRPTSSPHNESGMSTPSPSRLCLTETVKNLSAGSLTEANSCWSSVSSSQSPFTTSASNVLSIALPRVLSLDKLDSNDSCESCFLLPQEMEVSPGESVNSRSPPKLELFFQTSHLNHNLTNACKNKSLQSTDKNLDTGILLPPVLSPLNSPLRHIVISATLVEFENQNDPKMLPENLTAEIHDVNENNHACEQKEISPTNVSCSSPSIIESEELQCSGESSTDKGSCTSEKSNDEPEDLEEPEVLDEIEAYEQDILLVEVFQEDPDLFEELPRKSLLKLGPDRTSGTPKTGCKKLVKIMPPVSESSRANLQSVTPVNLDFLHNSPENSPRRPWRPQCNSSSALQSSTKKIFKIMGPAEARVVNTGEERTEHFPTENLCHSQISPILASRLGPPTRTTNMTNAAEVRWQKPAYCRKYFFESENCGFKMCRFHHVPMEGDEKFCTETVAWFAKNAACLYKAGAIFTSYYQNNKPGQFFSKPVFISLLCGLLQAGMLSDIFSVLRTSLAHNIVPEYEFLLDLFNFIREKSLMSFVPELMQLTFKMVDAGLPLSLDCLDCVKNPSDMHHAVSSDSTKSLSGHRLVSPTEHLNLALAVVEMELCTKKEDWKKLGEVFKFICQSTQISQVERIIGRIAVALLSESKDRLTLPFATFAETAVDMANEDRPVKSSLGRIGVSLMLRYHKTHQWAKGQKVVEALSAAKVSYATMKGLFGNEDGTSRCHLVSVATELFLLNGSVEGALNTLRENGWFLTSSAWPCEATDLDKRTHVLLGLAEQTSHRDTLEVLRNLPGIKEPNGHIDISKYTSFFTAHLQVCLDRQILVLASDLVDFMLSKNLTVDHAMLQMLLHRLGKQNFWLKAREIFRNSVSKGYHPEVSAPPGLMTLMVPSQLGEIELALTYEMFLTVNASAILALPECTTSTMTITLKRTQSCESDYLSAGSRLLSAACIPQPKLSVHYTAVNSSQEQLFILNISSARRWLRHNHLWANEVWTLST